MEKKFGMRRKGFAMILRKVDRDDGVEQYIFFCPGCKCGHYVIVKGDSTKMPVWIWNGNVEKPTFSPSIRVRASDSVCHTYVREGMIQFLGDCTHKLANQTVPMEDF